MAKEKLIEWTITDPIDQTCPHVTADAGGAVASELHGVCIFCWRDRLGKAMHEIDLMSASILDIKAGLQAILDDSRAIQKVLSAIATSEKGS